MRDYLSPVDAAQVQTELGAIDLTPTGKSGVRVNAPHLTVDGIQLSASALLVSDGKSCNFNLLAQCDPQTGIWSTADTALQARLVDGRVADIAILGKLAQIIVPAVHQFAEQHWALFLEAERRNIHNELGKLESQLEHDRSKLEEKERELAAVNEALSRFPSSAQ